MLNLNALMIGTKQPKALADFYEKVLQKPADWADPEHSYWGWQVGSTYLMIGEHSEVDGMASDPSRMIFNFETAQVKEEFKRIKKIGAKVIKEPYELEGGWIATLADPDGNYFQLVTPMNMTP